MPRRSRLALSFNVRLFTSLALLTILGSSTVQAQAPPPPLSDNLLNTPGPSGGARLGDFYYIYARNPTTNRVQVRKTNGVPGEGSGTSWTTLPSLTTDCYPAAAPVCTNTMVPVAQKISVIARRMSDGQLMVTQTSTGNSGFAAWKVIPGGIPGTKTDVSPTAVWFRPTLRTGAVDTTRGGVVVFYSNLIDGSLYFMYSSDGYNTWSVPEPLAGSNFASGPTAVVENNFFPTASWIYSLRVEFKTNDASTLPGFNKQKILRDFDLVAGGTWGVGFTDCPMKSPANRKDPGITGKVGSIIIEPDPSQWAGFHMPEVTTMRANVMKFHLSYDGIWNGGASKFYVPYSAIRDCVTAGVKTIILRTTETPLIPTEMRAFMQTVKFPDQDKTVASLAADFPEVRWIIEVGNEPDHIHHPDPNRNAAFYRDRALALVVPGGVKSEFPQFKWMISMPIDNTSDHLFAYSKEFAKVINGKSVLSEYDGAGVHAYSDNNLAWNNTGEEPLGALHFALARLPYDKFIHMSEVGLNSRQLDWAAKGLKYRNAIYAAPAVVEGWEFFCLSAHPEWNTFTHYCLDKNYTDKEVTQVTPFGGDLTSINFNSTTVTYPDKTPIAIKNCWLKKPPGADILLEGSFNTVGKVSSPLVAPLAPTESPGVTRILRNTDGTTGVNLSHGQGWVDAYPLTTSSGRPGATALGDR